MNMQWAHGRHGGHRIITKTPQHMMSMTWAFLSSSRTRTTRLLMVACTCSYALVMRQLFYLYLQSFDATTNIAATVAVAIPTETTTTGTTKIVTVVDYNYRDIAMKWYQRLTNLGYTSHVIVVADGKALQFFAKQTEPSFRYESILQHQEQEQLPWTLHAGREIWTLRWRYVRRQLELGNNLVLTDSDNIFTRYINLTEFEEFDVIHSFGTMWPFEIFKEKGFVVSLLFLLMDFFF
jgi:hypothetical protein